LSRLPSPRSGCSARSSTRDFANLPHIQKGLETTRYDGVVFNLYQENRIRHYHQILEEWMAR
jgi:hypothetical protein